MKLEQLFHELTNNPNVIKDIEEEIQLLIMSPSLENTYTLYNSQIPEMRIYALKVIEERIKMKKEKNVTLEQEIFFMKNIIYIDSHSKTSEVFAKLGLYEWPKNFSDFIQIIIDLISLHKENGYKILYNFLHLVNNSQEINEKRKCELKSAIGIINKNYMNLFEDDFVKYIIPILTELLKIIPKDFDYSIIFRKGAEFPESTIEFINERGDDVNLKDIIDLSSKLPINIGMLIFFNNLKNKSPNCENVSLMYEYMLKGLRTNLTTFLVSLEFWNKFFSSNNKDEFVDYILTEVVVIFSNMEVSQRLESESEVFGFFNLIIKKFPQKILEFLQTKGDKLERKIGLYFIKKLHTFNPDINLSSLHFSDIIINGTIMEFTNNPRSIDIIKELDLSDKESAKLVIKIINKFALSNDMLNEIIKASIFSDKENANEIIVECCIKLNNIESFDGNWDLDKYIRFFYYLRRIPMRVCQYAPNFYNEFLLKSPFDRCFSILKMLGNFPKELYEKIYNDIYRYSYEDLSWFNCDLLIYMQIQEPYIRREVARILHDWTENETTDALIQCVRSLLNVISAGINNSNAINIAYKPIDILFDLLNIDDSGIVRRICEMFCMYKNVYDVKKATYYLIVNYNSSFVEASHLNISSALTKCIKEKDGPEALSSILCDVTYDNCKNLQTECLKYNTKRAQALVRNFLQRFKGKPLNTLYEDNFKIKEQNFLNKSNMKTTSGLDVEFDNTFFN